MIQKYKGIEPKIGKNVYIHETAVVIGDVEIGDNVSVWPGAVIRGDVEKIIIGKDTNIQDLCVLHTSHNAPVIIGEGTTVGHNSNLHGCIVGNNTIIGIGAIVLDNSKVGNDSLVAAGSLVAPGKVYEDGVMLVGSPAQVKKNLDENMIEHNKLNCRHYIDKAKEYME